MSKPFRHLKLRRSLAILDLETTGIDPGADRIVEVGVFKIAPRAEPIRYRRLINPGVPIPPAATAVHHITDEDVYDRPRFKTIAPRLSRLLTDCDLAGYGLKRFDLAFLTAEFARVGIDFPLSGRAVVDAMQIFHAREPRDLSAAVRFFLGRAHEEAHGALEDAMVTAEVLDAQVARYEDLPGTVEGLHELLTDVDIGGRFRREKGRITFAFGKHAGLALHEVARTDPSYLRWMLNQVFLEDAKRLVEEALALVDERRDSE
jgi:DNA polymerase III subunit epsilon